ncbi:hypothetical protein [Dickeya phage Amaethon]|nr:hypothetical protein [Dickeya phage Amaethon]
MTTVMQKAIDAILTAGLTAIEHPNNSNDNEPNHLSIIGGAKRVEFWPTTGTVQVAGKNSIRGSNVNYAIKQAKGN